MKLTPSQAKQVDFLLRYRLSAVIAGSRIALYPWITTSIPRPHQVGKVHYRARLHRQALPFLIHQVVQLMLLSLQQLQKQVNQTTVTQMIQMLVVIMVMIQKSKQQ